MSFAPELMPDWKQWEGEKVEGQYPLLQLLGTGRKSAVYLTEDEKAIKLVPAAKDLAERWSRAARLKHPNLLPIVKTGTWDRDGKSIAYLLMERADDNLASVLEERPLTPEEAKEMLPPIAEALAYAHGEGYSLRSLNPSNVLAVGDTLKLAVDSAGAGVPSDDIKAMAVLIATALTGKPVVLPRDGAVLESLPDPFREICRNCMEAKWTAPELVARLRGDDRRVVRKNPAITKYVLGFAALLLVVITAGTIWRNRATEPAEKADPKPVAVAAAASPAPATVAAPAAEPPAPKAEPKAEIAPAVKGKAPEKPAEKTSGSAVSETATRQVMPDIPRQARNTIRGKATVVVRVAVNESGQVTDAKALKGSRYLGKLSVEAARQWTFPPGAERNYLLRFLISQADTKATIEQ